MVFRRRRREAITLDITPLVDCVFLLLIFFMLSTTFVIAPGIRVSLPPARSDGVETQSRDYRVKIDAAGLIYAGGEAVAPDALEEKLRRALEADRETMLVIEADEAARHKTVVEVMDRAKSAGMLRMAIATRPREERGGRGSP